MIYYSKNYLNVWQPGLIMLDLEDDLGHIYVTRNTYDQAVLIADRFCHDNELVYNSLRVGALQEDVVDYAKEVLPEPINILAPFFNLIDSNVFIDTDDIKQVIGVLSYISMNIDFNSILKVPVEVRANLVFNKSILKDYQGHFDDFYFKLSDSTHINSNKSDVNRSDREDYKITDDDVEEDVIDVEAFMADLGWDKITVPPLIHAVTPADVTETDKKIKAGDSIMEDKEATELSEYEKIVAQYSM